MRVAIFPNTEGTFGFRSPEGKDYEYISVQYHVVDLPENEVQELRDAFENFQKAQNKIARLLGKTRGMSESEMKDDDTYSSNK